MRPQRPTVGCGLAWCWPDGSLFLRGASWVTLSRTCRGGSLTFFPKCLQDSLIAFPITPMIQPLCLRKPPDVSHPLPPPGRGGGLEGRPSPSPQADVCVCVCARVSVSVCVGVCVCVCRARAAALRMLARAFRDVHGRRGPVGPPQRVSHAGSRRVKVGELYS